MSPSTGETCMELLPASLLQTLGLLQPERGWVLFVRHAEREPIPAGSFGNEVSLTHRGREQALELGRRLHGRLAGTSCSPLERSELTARLVSEGAGLDVSPIPDRRLGDPGPFIEDAELAGQAFRQLSMREIVNRMFDPATTPSGMRTASAGSLILLSAAREVLPSPERIHLLVSHDAILAPLMAFLVGDRDAEAHWPNYLDGIALSWENLELHYVARGIAGRVETRDFKGNRHV